MGGPDWEDGLGCGTCAQLEYQGNTVTVNVVDRWEQELGGHIIKFCELSPDDKLALLFWLFNLHLSFVIGIMQ